MNPPRPAPAPAPAPKPSAASRDVSRYADGPWAQVFAPRRSGEIRYWLIKSEPEVFSFDDLLKASGKKTHWDGVRNSAARNFMRDGMKKGDRCFFYHSNANPPAVVGICEVCREGYPDHTALDPGDIHFDPKSKADDPTWFMVDVKAVAAFPNPVTLQQIKADPSLAQMTLLRIGRLSVVPVTADEWQHICSLGGIRG